MKSGQNSIWVGFFCTITGSHFPTQIQTNKPNLCAFDFILFYSRIHCASYSSKSFFSMDLAPFILKHWSWSLVTHVLRTPAMLPILISPINSCSEADLNRRYIFYLLTMVCVFIILILHVHLITKLHVTLADENSTLDLIFRKSPSSIKFTF